MKKLPIIVVAFLIFVDQITKFFAVKHLSNGEDINFLDGFLAFSLTWNEGAAWGIFSGGRWFFVVATVVILGAVCVYYTRLPKVPPYGLVRVSLVLISGGALGNFLDRLLAGRVIDFLKFTFVDFPIFNMADVFVVCGTALLAFLLLFVLK